MPDVFFHDLVRVTLGFDGVVVEHFTGGESDGVPLVDAVELGGFTLELGGVDIMWGPGGAPVWRLAEPSEDDAVVLHSAAVTVAPRRVADGRLVPSGEDEIALRCHGWSQAWCRDGGACQVTSSTAAVTGWQFYAHEPWQLTVPMAVVGDGESSYRVEPAPVGGRWRGSRTR